MRLDTDELRKKIKQADRGSISGNTSSLESAFDVMNKNAETKARNITTETGKKAANVSYIDNDEDVRRAKSEAKLYADPIVYAAATIVASTMAEHAVKDLDRQIENMKVQKYAEPDSGLNSASTDNIQREDRYQHIEMHNPDRPAIPDYTGARQDTDVFSGTETPSYGSYYGNESDPYGSGLSSSAGENQYGMPEPQEYGASGYSASGTEAQQPYTSGSQDHVSSSYEERHVQTSDIHVGPDNENSRIQNPYKSHTDYTGAGTQGTAMPYPTQRFETSGYTQAAYKEPASSEAFGTFYREGRGDSNFFDSRDLPATEKGSDVSVFNDGYDRQSIVDGSVKSEQNISQKDGILSENTASKVSSTGRSKEIITGESVYEHNMKGLLDKDADVKVMRGDRDGHGGFHRPGEYSHIDDNGRHVLGPDNDARRTELRGKTEMSWAGIRHDMDIRLSNLNETVYQNTVSIEGLKTFDGMDAKDLFSDDNHSRSIVQPIISLKNEASGQGKIIPKELAVTQVHLNRDNTFAVSRKSSASGAVKSSAENVINPAFMTAAARNTVTKGRADSFFRESIGETRSHFVHQNIVSFTDKDGKYIGLQDGFHGIIKDHKIDLDLATKKGYTVSLAQDQVSKRVFGVVFTKTDNDIVIKNHRATMSSLNQIVSDSKLYQSTLIPTLTVRQRLNPANVYRNRQILNGLNNGQRAMLKAGKTAGFAKGAKGFSKLMSRRLTTRFIRLATSQMYNDQSFSTGFGMTQTYWNRTRLAGRIMRKPLSFVGTMAHRKIGTRIDRALIKRMAGRWTKAKAGGVHRKILSQSMKIIFRLQKTESLSALMGTLVYQGTVGLGGALLQAPASAVAAVTRKVPGVRRVTGAVADGIRSGRQQLAGLNSFGELSDVVKGSLKKTAKNTGKLAGKGIQQAGKGADRLGHLLLEKRADRINEFGRRFGKRLAAPFRRIGSFAAKIGKAVKNSRFVRLLARLGEQIKSVFIAIQSFLGSLAIMMAVVMIIMVVVYYIAAIGYAFIGTFSLVASDDTVPQTAADGQPTVAPLVGYLSQMHADEIRELKKKLKQPRTYQEIIYDNGSRENYRECITAMSIMEGQNYGNYGQKKVQKALQMAYDKSHTIYIQDVEREFTGTRTVTNAKGEQETVTYTYTEIWHQVHLIILRDTAVVDPYEAAVDTATNEGAAEYDAQGAPPATALTKAAEECKRTFSKQIGFYSQGVYRTIKYDDGTRRIVRPDCSGFVSECLRRLGIPFGGVSKTFRTPPAKYFYKYQWNGDTRNIKEGDILVYDGHVEIAANDGASQVWNYGNDTAASNPGRTNRWRRNDCICYLRLKTSQIKEKTKDEGDSSSRSGSNTKSGSSTYVKTVKNDSEATLDYDTMSTKINWEEKSTTKGGHISRAYVHTGYVPGGQTATYYGSVSFEGSWTIRDSSYGKRNVLFSMTNCASNGGRYVQVADGSIKGLPSGEKLWVIALGATPLSEPMHGQTDSSIIGQIVELKLANGKSTFCVVGDLKSPGDATALSNGMGHGECDADTGKCSGANYFEMIGDYSSSSAAAENLYGVEERSHSKDFVRKIIVYNKNIIPGNGFFKGSHHPSPGSVEITSGSTGGFGSGFVPDYKAIEYDSWGDEIGGRIAIKQELDKFCKAYADGSYRQEIMYNSKEHTLDPWKEDRQHTLKKSGGKGTGLDFLRCCIYARHGVTLPKTYSAVWNEPGMKYKVKQKANGRYYYDYTGNIQTGDIIVYQINMKKPLTRKNCILFSYYGTDSSSSDMRRSKVVGLMNENFRDKAGFFHPQGAVVRMYIDDLYLSHIVNAIDVRGITVDKRYLAYPEVGFGGFRSQTDMKSIYPTVKNSDGEKVRNGYRVGEVETFKNTIGEKDLWYDYLHPSGKKGEKVSDGGKQLDGSTLAGGSIIYYDGYCEQDFNEDSIIKTPGDREVLRMIDRDLPEAIAYVGNRGLLPSTFLTEAVLNSNAGQSYLWGQNKNPVGLRKWWPDSEDGMAPYSSYSVDSHGYLRFKSFRDCAEAWVWKNFELNGSDGSGLGATSKTVDQWRYRCSEEYAKQQADNNGDPAYIYALKYYLNHIQKDAEGDTEINDNADSTYMEWLGVCQGYDLPKYDESYNGDKYDSGDDPGVSDDVILSAASGLYYHNSANVGHENDINIEDLIKKQKAAGGTIPDGNMDEDSALQNFYAWYNAGAKADELSQYGIIKR